MFCLQEVGTEERALRPKGRQKTPASQGGRRGRCAPTKQGAGAFGPAPCFGFAGPLGPQNAAAPPHPNGPRLPHAIRASIGLTPATPGKAGGPTRPYGGRRRLAAGGAPRAPPPPKKKAGAGGFASGSRFSGRFAPCRRPPWALEAPQRPNDRAVPPHAPPAGTERRKRDGILKPFVNNF